MQLRSSKIIKQDIPAIWPDYISSHKMIVSNGIEKLFLPRFETLVRTKVEGIWGIINVFHCCGRRFGKTEEEFLINGNRNDKDFFNDTFNQFNDLVLSVISDPNKTRFAKGFIIDDNQND